MKIFIYCDGGSRGNPGQAAIGGILLNEKGEEIARYSEKIGITTNNQAEYKSLLKALTLALELEATEVSVTTDSQLMERQINGVYKVRNSGIIPLSQEVKKIVQNFSKFKIVHRRRSEEKMPVVDRLVNEAMDEK